MSYLILVRHGQSVWNLEKKFTGWVDVDLTENGKLEAKKSGELIKSKNIEIDIYYSSFQLRAKNTLNLIKEILNDKKISKQAWQLNERHYGSLTGLNKDEMKVKLGEEKVHQFRRSWDLRPEPLDKNNPYHPINIDAYKEIPINKIPDTESLKDTYERVINFYKQEIENKTTNNNILIPNQFINKNYEDESTFGFSDYHGYGIINNDENNELIYDYQNIERFRRI